MIAVYNLYLGGYLPKVSPKTNVHNKRELKTKYKDIVSLNNTKPLVMVQLSDETQAYALDVKEKSMELGEAAQNTLDGKAEDREKSRKKMTELFNALLERSDDFGRKNGKPSRPGGELRVLVASHADELEDAGFSVDEKGFLAAPEETAEWKVPVDFVTQLREKCEHMSMNPMEYVEKKVYSYAHLFRSDVGTPYEPSIYSGMLFNSYC